MLPVNTFFIASSLLQRVVLLVLTRNIRFCTYFQFSDVFGKLGNFFHFNFFFFLAEFPFFLFVFLFFLWYLLFILYFIRLLSCCFVVSLFIYAFLLSLYHIFFVFWLFSFLLLLFSCLSCCIFRFFSHFHCFLSLFVVRLLSQLHDFPRIIQLCPSGSHWFYQLFVLYFSFHLCFSLWCTSCRGINSHHANKCSLHNKFIAINVELSVLCVCVPSMRAGNKKRESDKIKQIRNHTATQQHGRRKSIVFLISSSAK